MAHRLRCELGEHAGRLSQARDSFGRRLSPTEFD